MFMKRLLPLMLYASFASAVAHAEIHIEHPVVRVATKNIHSTAYYMHISNTGPGDDTLTGATSPIASHVMIHNTLEKQGINRMFEVDKLAVPAHQVIVLKPGGLHIMAVGLKEDIKAGDKVPLTLIFEKAGNIDVLAVAQ